MKVQNYYVERAQKNLNPKDIYIYNFKYINSKSHIARKETEYTRKRLKFGRYMQRPKIQDSDLKSHYNEWNKSQVQNQRKPISRKTKTRNQRATQFFI